MQIFHIFLDIEYQYDAVSFKNLTDIFGLNMEKMIHFIVMIHLFL
mgnify:CR=1 FL=1